MFSLFNRKPNYRKIFSSPIDTHKYLYSERSKTAELLGDESFIEAWLESENRWAVMKVILAEAAKGDIPSIKQMIWYFDVLFQSPSTSEEGKVMALQTRIELCEAAVTMGLKEFSYKAMVSCSNLFSIAVQGQTPPSDQMAKQAINGAIRHANLFLKSGYEDPELINDARQILKSLTVHAQAINALVESEE
ncbi:MAG TPA: hypothetical protein DFS52_16985 [Myxococcales bacterium]|nr:hypothetical protein [Myxococcales bacterium]